MSTAQKIALITFAFPTTRVNGGSLPASEVRGVDIYDACTGDGSDDTEEADDPRTARPQTPARPLSTRPGIAPNQAVSGQRPGEQAPNQAALHQPAAQGSQAQGEGQRHTQSQQHRGRNLVPNDQDGSPRDAARDQDEADKAATNAAKRRHRKIGSTTGDATSFETPPLSSGLHYFSLVVVDTEGRTSSPSSPFKLDIDDDSTKHDDTRPQQEPSQPAAVAGVGTDEDRPSLITQVNVVLQ